MAADPSTCLLPGPGADLRVRRATTADDAFFADMEFHTTWASLEPEDRERLGEQQVRAALQHTHELLLSRPDSQVLVVETVEGERVGILWFGANRNLVTGEDEAWVYNVSVVPEHQGRGIGLRIMAHAEALARERGHAVLGLMVSAHNDRARRLYEKRGFRPSNLLMRRRLDP